MQPSAAGHPAAGASVGYVAPFAVFVALMGIERAVGLPAQISYPIRFAAAALTIWFFSRPYLPRRLSRPFPSVTIGAAVFVIWVAPDALFCYRHFWLFENILTGSAKSSLAPELMHNVFFLALRSLGSTLLVPIVEELFWRGWLMRWLIDRHFLRVPLGSYTPSAFWITALLFASEHGPFWEVGLVAGIIYNWWLVRTRNLADCMVAHAVTNGVLSAYVMATGHWQYWP